MMMIKLSDGLEIDIDFPVHPTHSDRRLLLHIVAELKHQRKQINKIMIDQATIDASIGRLETDVHNLIAALPGNTVPSTPDTVVTSLLGRVDGLSTAAEAALAGTGTGGTTPPPPPAPTP